MRDSCAAPAKAWRTSEPSCTAARTARNAQSPSARASRGAAQRGMRRPPRAPPPGAYHGRFNGRSPSGRSLVLRASTADSPPAPCTRHEMRRWTMCTHGRLSIFASTPSALDNPPLLLAAPLGPLAECPWQRVPWLARNSGIIRIRHLPDANGDRRPRTAPISLMHWPNAPVLAGSNAGDPTRKGPRRLAQSPAPPTAPNGVPN